MNSRTIKLLEYNRILEMLAEQAGSELTKERISKVGTDDPPACNSGRTDGNYGSSFRYSV